DVSDRMNLDGDHAGGRFDAMNACCESPEVFESDGESDHAVAGNVEISGIVEEDHAGFAGRVSGLAEDRADHCIGPARLADHRRAKAIELRAQPLALFRN